ncbi:methyl-accepting chemotaxis protein [Bacillaceae bacterium W0354]
MIKKIRRLFTKSLQRQFLIPVIILILFTGVAVAGTSYFITMDQTMSNSEDNLSSQVTALEGSFDSLFTNVEHNINRLAGDSSLGAYRMMGDKINDRFRELVLSSPYYLNVYFGTVEGGMILYPHTDLPDDYDPRDRDWYIQAIENEEEVIWTDPYVDAASGQVVVTAAKANISSGKLNGVFAIDLTVSDLLSLVDEVVIGDSGYVMILSTNGYYVTHPDEELVFQSAENESFYEFVMNNESGQEQFQLNGEDILFSHVTNDEAKWKVIGTASVDEMRSQANQIIFPIIITVGVVIIAALLILILLTRRVTKPIRALQQGMRRAGDGDLTVDIQINRDDEIGHLSEHFNTMLKNVRGLLENVHRSSQKVSESAENVVANAEENSAASQEVASTIQHIASGATSQAQLVDENHHSVSDLSDQINEVVEQNNAIQKSSMDLLNKSKDALEAVNKLRSHSNSTNEMTKEMHDSIQILHERSENISEVVLTLSEIASRTNLLALNAAIEAARAGESGKGFAVVAEEVRKLAEQTEQSLENVSAMVENMQEQTDTIVELISKTNLVMGQQIEVVDQTEGAFKETFETVTLNNSAVEKIIKTMEEMVKKKDELVERMEEISSVTQETTAGTEQVSASVEEMSASMEQLNDLAQNLEEVSVLLKEEINRFKI